MLFARRFRFMNKKKGLLSFYEFFIHIKYCNSIIPISLVSR